MPLRDCDRDKTDCEILTKSRVVMKKHRESILKAAGAVFSRKGFHGASVEEIARKAGVGKGTIYLYFEDKTRLFAATVTEGMEQMIGQLRSQLNSDLPFMEHLRQMIENNVDVYRNFGDLMKIVATELTRGIDKKVLAEIEAVRDRYVDFIAETLENGHRLGYVRAVDFRLVAQAIVGSLDGFFRFPMSMKSEEDRDRIVDTLYQLVSGGLIVPRPRFVVSPSDAGAL
jgi:AcrR family transcriptional regulator